MKLVSNEDFIRSMHAWGGNKIIKIEWKIGEGHGRAFII